MGDMEDGGVASQLTLTLLGQTGTTPDNGTMMMLILSLTRGDLNQRLLQRIHGAQNALDALDLTRASMCRLHRAISARSKLS